MRKTMITLTALGLVTALAAAAPTQAEARDWGHRGGTEHNWRGHDWRGHDWRGHGSGAAVGLGILGAITGAAIASSQAYYAPPAYYYQPTAPYYAPGYSYATPYGYAGYGYYR